ncbi:MAG: hypothetical protein AAF624_17795, partial [Bacteroidota bacterium]
PHIDSIRIHAFTYGFGDGPRTELLANYEDAFWMQGNTRYNTTGTTAPAVSYHESAVVTVEVALTLNGEAYTVRQPMAATTRTRFYPVVLDLLR